jgi:hypothetical protein
MGADLGDDGFGFGLSTAIVNQDLCAFVGKCHSARPADAAGSSGN